MKQVQRHTLQAPVQKGHLTLTDWLWLQRYKKSIQYYTIQI